MEWRLATRRDLNGLIQMEPQISAPDAVEELIARAESLRASDIHLQMRSGGADIYFRLDGVMTPAGQVEGDLAERMFGRIKFLARLKTYQESLPQDGRIAKTDVHAENDLRVATYPTVTGEKIVLRLFIEEQARSFEDLGLAPATVAALHSALRKTAGLILLTGPAGSGKTSTIYACLRHLVKGGGRHIITVEDPVEQIIPGVMQTEVNETRGLTFAAAARHLLRQDPQVLVIGEVRDEETARIAVRAASTGHLLIATIHAGSAPAVMDRLLLLCPDSFSVFGSLELILNQRLIRKFCAHCHGVGCSQCLGTGYFGRIALTEFVQVSDEIRGRLRSCGTTTLQPASTMFDQARELVENGITDRRELERVFGG